MDETDIQAADPKLYDCLVGYFIGKKLSFKLVEESLKRAWGLVLTEVLSNGRGLFLLRFSDKEFRRKLLEGGPITLARIPFILQQWQPGIELKRDSHMSVPIWLRLRNLPFEYWSAQAISKAVSSLGKPLYVDQRTEQMSMISFARVCVEITARQTLYDCIDLVTDGRTDVVEVEYEWRPLVCAKCDMFGHSCQNTVPVPVTEVGGKMAHSQATSVMNPESESLVNRGKGVVVPASSEYNDNDSRDTRRGLVSAVSSTDMNASRPLVRGESSSQQMAPSRPAEPMIDHDSNADIAEPEDTEMWSKQTKRKNKRLRKKQAAREAVAAAAEASRATTVSKASFSLSPITEEDQLLQRNPSKGEDDLHSPSNVKSPAMAEPTGSDPSMIVQESSQDVSSSSSQEESSDDDLPKADERVSKPSNHMTERLQDHLADMLEASPLPVGPKKPAKGAKTSRKR